ncbi:hypothetical protein GCM10023238_03900 [Streptomyces heliomycini]
MRGSRLGGPVHFAVAVARTDPGTRPRTGLSAIGLGAPPGWWRSRGQHGAGLALLGSDAALLVFLQLRGDLTAQPSRAPRDGLPRRRRPLPLPAAPDLLALVPLSAARPWRGAAAA